jgi:C-terminal processing protease CtpA/Prc
LEAETLGINRVSNKIYIFTKIQYKMKQLRLLLPAVYVFIISCQKETDPGQTPTPPVVTTPTKEQLLMDSVYLYTKETYLWNDMIPSYTQFNPRQYKGSTELESAEKVMNAVRALQPLDHFSFVTTMAASDGLQTGDDVDFGFFISAAAIDKVNPVDSVYWFVTYVYDQSTAGLAGVKRGWYIYKINGNQIGYDQGSLNVLNNLFFGTATNASFEFKKPDGTTVIKSLSKSAFTANSVLHKSVINTGGKKVGYFVFNQFFGQTSRNELGQVFAYFQTQGINELVVDLRYNPGGSVDTQDTLSNLVAPLSANGKTMYSYVFNQTLQSNQHQLIRKKLGYGNIFSAAANSQIFEKKNTLNLSRVFVIVTGGSASASELFINNLKPYMDVKLVGDTTYGKPVGFFPIPIYDYAIYPISFKTVNSVGNADYYSGFAPDKLTPDGVDKDWGDVQEPSLAAALKYITTGSFRLSNSSSTAQDLQYKAMKEIQPINNELTKHKFSGMFIERRK